MAPEPQWTSPDPPEPHPLDAVREQAARTTPAHVRAQLNDLSAQQTALAAGGPWSAAAEATFRQVIGMERKAGLEMRVALGEKGQQYLRSTRNLGDMPLPELQTEYAQTRQVTLALLDELLATPGVRAWTLGEEVLPEIYIVALHQRLKRLGEALAQEQLKG
ncbi:hypothetical protein [Deinococcus fonticola]|uniref:hypothetical protein n=1 Tax=Deinococcus fonticola TaxID=2528713 RepID=UPI00107559F2|nr:hypothetical protein [Deinococcus fonticola]